MHAIVVVVCVTLLLSLAATLVPLPALAQSSACTALNGSAYNSPSNTVVFAPSDGFVFDEPIFGDPGNPGSAGAFQAGETINWEVSLSGTPEPGGDVFFSLYTDDVVLADLSYSLDGAFVDSGSHVLQPNEGGLFIVWLGEDFTGTLTMRVWCTGLASSDATLSALSLSAGALDPAFAPATTAYTIDVPNSTNSTTVTPTATDAGATIEVNGAPVASGAASGSIALAVGPNLITIEVTAEDGVTVETYTVTVNRAAPVTLTLSPPAGALPDGEVGTAYAESFVASGGSGNYTYAVTAGALPAGLTLAADGSLAGTPTTVETANFTVTASDVDVPANSGSAAYALEILAAPPASSNARLAGLQPSTGSLEPGFDPTVLAYVVNVANEVETITVTPTAADSNASITVNGQAVPSGTASQPVALAVGPNPIQVVVTAEDGTTILTYSVTVVRAILVRPDPSLDTEVRALLTAQSRTATRFARNQMRNFHRRLEQLHNEGDRRASSMNVRLGFAQNNSSSAAQREIDQMIANSHATSAGMLGYGTGGRPALARPGDPQPNRSSPLASPDLGPFAVWTGGFVNFGERDSGGLDLNHTMIGVSGGVDYRFSERFVGGIGLGFGRDRTEIGRNETESRANAFSAALYGSYKPIDNLFIDGLLGASWLNFDSRRFVTPTGEFATGSRRGTQLFGSLTAGYEFRDENWLISPYGRVEFSRSWLHRFTETGGGIYGLSYGDQTIDTWSGVLGIRANYGFQMNWGVLTPGIRAEYMHDFAGSSRASLGYADLGGLPYAIETDPSVRDFITLGLSLDMQFQNDWNFGVDYRSSFAARGNRDHTFGARLGARF